MDDFLFNLLFINSVSLTMSALTLGLTFHCHSWCHLFNSEGIYLTRLVNRIDDVKAPTPAPPLPEVIWSHWMLLGQLKIWKGTACWQVHLCLTFASCCSLLVRALHVWNLKVLALSPSQGTFWFSEAPPASISLADFQWARKVATRHLMTVCVFCPLLPQPFSNLESILKIR